MEFSSLRISFFIHNSRHSLCNLRLVGNKVGAVFAAQVSYFVTVAGVVWSMVILDEVHSKFIWMSLVCMILGMALVKPDLSRMYFREAVIGYFEFISLAQSE